MEFSKLVLIFTLFAKTLTLYIDNDIYEHGSDFGSIDNYPDADKGVFLGSNPVVGVETGFNTRGDGLIDQPTGSGTKNLGRRNLIENQLIDIPIIWTFLGGTGSSEGTKNTNLLSGIPIIGKLLG